MPDWQAQWADPAYSARGNQTSVPKPSALTSTTISTYDAFGLKESRWENRLVEVKSGANVVLKCEYDGLGRGTTAEGIKYCVPGIPRWVCASGETVHRVWGLFFKEEALCLSD